MAHHTIRIITATGEYRPATIPDAPCEALDAMQAIVGGYLEVVPLAGSRYLVFHAEGKIENLPPNPIATKLAHDSEAIMADDYIAGDAIVGPRSLFGDA